MMKLRGHHLICLHFFTGEGYTREFVDNLNKVLSKAEVGEEIEVINSADDVCIKCPHLKEGICSYKEGFEEEIRKMDLRACKLLEISYGTRIKWGDIKRRLKNVLKEWIKHYCKECQYRTVCEKKGLFE